MSQRDQKSQSIEQELESTANNYLKQHTKHFCYIYDPKSCNGLQRKVYGLQSHCIIMHLLLFCIFASVNITGYQFAYKTLLHKKQCKHTHKNIPSLLKTASQTN